MENSNNLKERNILNENNFDKSIKSHKLLYINPIPILQNTIKKQLSDDENIISSIKEKQYKDVINSHKKYIFKKNYENKLDTFFYSNKSTNNKSKKLSIMKPKIIPLEEYIERIKQKYKEHPIYFEKMNKYNDEYHYLFSFCFFCYNPVVAYDNKVICINGCLNLDVRTEEFNENYTLDKFLNQHYEFTSEHLLCNGDINPVFVDGEGQTAFFICNKCDKETFEKVGIKL